MCSQSVLLSIQTCMKSVNDAKQETLNSCSFKGDGQQPNEADSATSVYLFVSSDSDFCCSFLLLSFE